MKDVNGVMLNEKTWSLTFVKKKNLPPDRWGDCNVETKMMRVRSDLCDYNVLATAIHEMLHASSFHLLDEDWVDVTSTEIARVLLKSQLVKVNRDQDLSNRKVLTKKT
jgi:hypothetical protein